MGYPLGTGSEKSARMWFALNVAIILVGGAFALFAVI